MTRVSACYQLMKRADLLRRYVSRRLISEFESFRQKLTDCSLGAGNWPRPDRVTMNASWIGSAGRRNQSGRRRRSREKRRRTRCGAGQVMAFWSRQRFCRARPCLWPWNQCKKIASGGTRSILVRSQEGKMEILDFCLQFSKSKRKFRLSFVQSVRLTSRSIANRCAWRTIVRCIASQTNPSGS